jgi:hypothetical protein
MSFGPALAAAANGHRPLRRALVAFTLALVAGGYLHILSYPCWAAMPPELLANVHAQTAPLPTVLTVPQPTATRTY